LANMQFISGVLGLQVRPMTRRTAGLVLTLALSAAIFWTQLKALVGLSLSNDAYSQIALTPLMSTGLIVAERKRIFAHLRYSPVAGAALLAAVILCYGVARIFSRSASPEDGLALMAVSMVLFWLAGFTCFYGIQASHAGAFALLCLFLMVPLPGFLLARIILALRQGSAVMLGMLYSLLQVPFQRDGFNFALPGINIGIAPECSGIRSSISLFVTGLLAAHFFLRTASRKTVLMLFVVPIAVLKNVIRIATISLLSVYVDPSFLNGWLHHKGGFVFSILSMGMLVPILCLLHWSERRTPSDGKLRHTAATESSAA